MSERLCIGSTKETYHDFIITNKNVTVHEISEEWLSYHKGYYVGPWKIRITDLKLHFKIEKRLEYMFRRLGKTYPDCIWFFYYGDKSIEHPTNKELHKWLRLSRKKGRINNER